MNATSTIINQCFGRRHEVSGKEKVKDEKRPLHEAFSCLFEWLQKILDLNSKYSIHESKKNKETKCLLIKYQA